MQFDRELDRDRQVHPGFFDLDYGDYYDTHVASVEQIFLDLEQRGTAVVPRGSSHMLPLRRRKPVSQRSNSSTLDRCGTPMIVSIDGDWTGDFGHFGPWERALAIAAHAAGYGYATLASRGSMTRFPRVLPTFTHGTLQRELLDLHLLERELEHGLQQACGDGTRYSCAVNVADVWLLSGVLQVVFAAALVTPHSSST